MGEFVAAVPLWLDPLNRGFEKGERVPVGELPAALVTELAEQGLLVPIAEWSAPEPEPRESPYRGND